MWHQLARFLNRWPPFCYITIIFNHLKLWIASARHNFKWVKLQFSNLVFNRLIWLLGACVGVRWPREWQWRSQMRRGANKRENKKERSDHDPTISDKIPCVRSVNKCCWIMRGTPCPIEKKQLCAQLNYCMFNHFILLASQYHQIISK